MGQVGINPVTERCSVRECGIAVEVYGERTKRVVIASVPEAYRAAINPGGWYSVAGAGRAGVR